MKHTKLAKAISCAVTAVALTAGSVTTASATVTTMYNLTNTSDFDAQEVLDILGIDSPIANNTWQLHNAGTDGWIYGYKNPVGINDDPEHTVASWAGTTGTHIAPFGHVSPHLNWAVEITGGQGGAGTISTFDSYDRYGVYADIDTAKGAWSDASLTGAGGWRHDLDFGLFKSDANGRVTLNAEGILQSGTNFGFTILKGMETLPNYNHHGAWNAGNNASGPSENSLPNTIEYEKVNADGTKEIVPANTSFSISDIVAYSVGGVSPANLNTISFDAEAGQIYTIILGGYRNGGWVETIDGYSLDISQTVSNVPIPGAVWLFGSALAGFVGIQRRKQCKA